METLACLYYKDAYWCMRKFGIFVIRADSLIVLRTIDLLNLENENFSRDHLRYIHVFADLMQSADKSEEIPSLGLLHTSVSVVPADYPANNFAKLPHDCVAYDVARGLIYHA